MEMDGYVSHKSNEVNHIKKDSSGIESTAQIRGLWTYTGTYYLEP